ncbi:DUF1642 domain-containing protein [Streptococcus ictaluri]|uniref:Uncharacterized protein n=1 Tax=Streptococcus ictaluri 707-05 TaxID=764299 RepID=G5K5K5_9STRE|nr:hypothetical protein STRIC_2121 [Streptococcus ictaluri 707-05]
MNIEEAIKKIRELDLYGLSPAESKKAIIPIVCQIKLDQQKVVVPKFVAEWYEEHKNEFYLNLHKLAWELIENLDEDYFVPEKALDSDFKRWYHKNKTAIQTLINMHQFGYDALSFWGWLEKK